MSILTDDFLDMLPDTVTIQWGLESGFGAFIPSGEAASIPCYIEGRIRLVADPAGLEVTSRIQIYVDPGPYTVRNHRYTIPDRFDPYQDIKAIAIEPFTDEFGPHHDVINLP
jgi:hypothetical protein